jgi:hypothetical protein
LIISFLSRQGRCVTSSAIVWRHGQSNNFIADVFLGRQLGLKDLSCASSLVFIRKGKADSLARLRAEPWFSAWRWPRLRRTPAWEAAPVQALPVAAVELRPEPELPEAPLELRPEQAVAEGAEAVGVEAVEPFIDRVVKPNS